MKPLIQKLKNLFAKLSGKAKTAAAKAAETPASQDAAHTAATAMSESMPMSGINGKKIFKTLFKNVVLLSLSSVFALTIFFIYKISADSGNNIIAMIRTGELYENAVMIFLPQNSGLAEEYRRRAAERYMEADKKLQDKIADDVAKSVNKQAADYSKFPVIPNIKDSNLLANIFPENPDSNIILADNLQKGGDIKNCDATIEHLKKAAMPKKGKGNKIAQYLLANFYYNAKCVEKDENQAFELLKMSADQGYDAAIADYATMFIIKADEEKGENSAANYKKAFKYLKKAAENGERFAQYKLGYLYINKPEIFESENPVMNFISRPFNKKLQFKRAQRGEYWLRRSAEQGEPTAQFLLGSIHYSKYLKWKNDGDYGNDDGIEYNSAEAEKWLKKAALSGDSRAMMQLGRMYDEGAFNDFAQKEIGLDYLNKAVKDGQEMAEILLSQKYINGDLPIIKKDKEKAIEYLKKAEKSSDKLIARLAKHNLASVYFVEKNYSEAYKYYREINGDYSQLEKIMAIYKYAKDASLKKEIIDYVIKETENKHFPSDKDKKHLLLMRLAYLHNQGDDIVKKDENKYKELIRMLAEDGSISGQVEQGEICEIQKNLAEAEEWYKKAAAQGSEDAMVHLAKMHYNEASSLNETMADKIPLIKYFSKKNSNYRKTVNWLKEAIAKSGNKEAYNMLGLMYYLGNGLKQDYGMALSCFTQGEAYNLLAWNDLKSRENLSALGFSKYFVRHEDNPKFIEKLEQKKAGGNKVSAKLLEDGIKYGTVDRAMAFTYLNLAKKEGDKNAAYMLSNVISREDFGWAVYMGWIEKAAKHGDSFCQSVLGDIFYEGKITAKDEKQAKEWYIKSANKGNSQGQYKLGLMYLEDGNYVEAEKWLSKAAEQGHSEAMLKLGIFYFNSYRMSKMKKAFELFDSYNEKNAGLKWDAETEFADGVRSFYGISQSIGIDRIGRSASMGYAPAMVLLGYISYNYGQYDSAAEYFKEAAVKGDCQGCLALAQTYYEKLGRQDEAMEWAKKGKETKNALPECSGALPSIIAKIALQQGIFSKEYADDLLKAAEKGNEESQIELGNLFYGIAEQMEGKTENNAAEHLESAKEILAKGKTAKYLYGQAAYWYENAANQTPDDTSCLKLGKMFYEGKGLRWHQKLFGRNYRLSLKWYSKAAELDSADALFAVGKMYYEGKGVRQNYYKAMQWLRRAAHKNNAEAQFRLGYVYENALGVYKNTDEAIKWYEKAAAQGHKEAQSALDKLAISNEK